MRSALVLLAVSLAACGGPTGSPLGSPAVTVPLAAVNIKFDPERLTVPAGVTFAIDFDNRDAAPHNVVISGPGVNQTSETFTGPAKRTYLFGALAAGTYTFICAVHPEMKGTIETVPAAAATQ